jgi:hypothetical protein
MGLFLHGQKRNFQEAFLERLCYYHCKSADIVKPSKEQK